VCLVHTTLSLSPLSLVLFLSVWSNSVNKECSQWDRLRFVVIVTPRICLFLLSLFYFLVFLHIPSPLSTSLSHRCSQKILGGKWTGKGNKGTEGGRGQGFVYTTKQHIT
jgi:hypothetical protein